MGRINKTSKGPTGEDWWRLPRPFDDQIIAFPESEHPNYFKRAKHWFSFKSGGHQMHCISFLWQFGYKDQWDYSAFNMTNLEFALHAEHCSRALFRILTCQADITPVLFQRDKSALGSWKTMNAPHRCKKFDRMVKWQAEHKLEFVERTASRG